MACPRTGGCAKCSLCHMSSPGDGCVHTLHCRAGCFGPGATHMCTAKQGVSLAAHMPCSAGQGAQPSTGCCQIKAAPEPQSSVKHRHVAEAPHGHSPNPDSASMSTSRLSPSHPGGQCSTTKLHPTQPGPGLVTPASHLDLPSLCGIISCIGIAASTSLRLPACNTTPPLAATSVREAQAAVDAMQTWRQHLLAKLQPVLVEASPGSSQGPCCAISP